MGKGRPRLGNGEYEKHLILSDIHSVFMDERAFSVALQVWAEGDFSSLTLNGDVLDGTAISSHKRKLGVGVNFTDELDFTYEKILKPLRDAKPNQTILYRYGNHDERAEKLYTEPYVMEQYLVAARNRNTTDLAQMLRLPELGITMSKNDVDVLSCRGRKFHLLHGYKTNKTRCENYLRDYGSGTSGHTHRFEKAERQTYYGKEIWLESGCLRTIDRVEYMASPFAGWTHGFVTVWFDKAYGQMYARQHEIVDYRAEYNGTLFKG